jgi:ribonuclease D
VARLGPIGVGRRESTASSGRSCCQSSSRDAGISVSAWCTWWLGSRTTKQVQDKVATPRRRGRPRGAGGAYEGTRARTAGANEASADVAALDWTCLDWRPLHPFLVQSDTTFLEIIKRIEQHSELAIDCEFQSEGHYYPKLCLLQLGFGTEFWAIDPRRVDLRPLAPVLESGAVRKVVHDGRQDLPILAKAAGHAAFDGAFDTQIAAAFLGYGGGIGYGALVQAICAVKLDKSLQASDWSRELSDAQIDYALDDVRYLSKVSATLRAALADKGRLTWAEQACAESTLRALRRPDPEKLYRRVASASRLNPAQLGILREVAKWRDLVAEANDKPVPSVANDLALKTMALRQPRDLREFETIRGLGLGRNPPWARRALDAIAEGVSKPEINARPAWSNEEEARIDGVMSLLRVARHLVAVRDGIAVEMLCDQAELRSLAESQITSKTLDASFSVLNGWRLRVLGELFLGVLSGELAFRVDSAMPAGVVFQVTNPASK